jgi:isopentenyl-diphosphate delta-isomerase
MDMTKVILVDENDNPAGEAEKMQAHIDGLLHRAFSVFIFNSKGEMLLQQRALEKYHSGGLWTNACCSHPVPGETTGAAAARRLQEEMGFSVQVEKIFDFVYKAEFDNGLTEHEFDHVFAGVYDGSIQSNPEEVMAFCYRAMDDISLSLQSQPGDYTAWFHLAFPKIESWWNRQTRDKKSIRLNS